MRDRRVIDGRWTSARRLIVAGLLLWGAVVVLTSGRCSHTVGVVMPDQHPDRQGITQRQSAVMLSYYQAAEERITREIAAAVRGLAETPDSGRLAFAQARLTRLQSLVEREIGALTQGTSRMVGLAVESSARLGVAQAEQQVEALGAPAQRLDLAASLSAGIDTGAIEVIARDSAARLAAANLQFGERAVEVFRRLSSSATTIGRLSEPAVNEAVAQGILSGDPRATSRAIRELFREPGEAESATAAEFRRLGDRQVVIGGWTGTAREYAALVAVTRTREATVTARHERLGRLNVGLVQITGRRSINFCTRFLNLVCALTSEASEGGRYVLLSSLPQGGPPFHPRCSKGTAAYIPELVSPARAASGEDARTRYQRDLESDSLTRPIAA